MNNNRNHNYHIILSRKIRFEGNILPNFIILESHGRKDSMVLVESRHSNQGTIMEDL